MIDISPDAMTTLIFTAAGILVSLLGSILGHVWLSIAGSVVAFVSAGLQYRDSMPYESVFTDASWAEDGTEYRSQIPASRHRKEKAVAEVYILESSGSYAQVGCDIRTDSTGAVLVGANMKFTGRVVVK